MAHHRRLSRRCRRQSRSRHEQGCITIAARRSSLTGSWSGAYRYPRDAFPETVFNASIEEIGGAFTGSTTEPDMLHRSPGGVITADIDGVRTDSDVSFTKFMDGSGGQHHVIRYSGVADAKLSRIDGTWIIPGSWSGSFFMMRDDDGAEDEAEITAEASLDQRQ